MKLKEEEGICLSIETRRREEDEDLGLRDEEARMKYEAEEQESLKAEEEYQIDE